MSKKLFDFCIGNPPYQEENEKNHRQSPVYDLFMEEAFNVSTCVELITPARFLFNAGQTPKQWNEKMLSDDHLKVLLYENDASKIFSNTDIKGGVSITIRDTSKNYGSIGVFTMFEELNSIIKKVDKHTSDSISSIAYPKSNYGFTDALYKDHPQFKTRLTKGNEYIVDANIFAKIPEIFSDQPTPNTVCVLGRENNRRMSKYIKKEYIKAVQNLEKYKVFVTGANGSGKFGEVLSAPFVAGPNEIATQTYMSIGAFERKEDAENCLKYIKSKFARCMLGVLKATQNNPRDTWKKIPIQNFTSSSDIDWTKTIHEIDLQLYRKYNLTKEEIDFIETNIKEMK